MKLLVTGGAGFIGSQFVRAVLGGGYPDLVGAQVTVLDKLTYSGNRANLDPVSANPALRFVHGDILDAELVDSLVAGQDAIVHFAAESHVDRSIEGAAQFVITNVLGTQTMLDAALRHRTGRFLHVSTDEVYGSIEQGSWTEEWPLAPNSPYSASKAGSDLLALAYHRTHGLDVVVTRCSNNYGHYQFPEKAIPLFVTNLLDGEQIPLYGDGGNIRDWLHVNDHCRGIALALVKGRVRRGLPHRWRYRAGQPGAGTAAARRVWRRLGQRPVRDRPQGARPPVLAVHRQDQPGTRVRPGGRAGRRAGRHGRLVPGEPGLVGAAQGTGRPG